jgi:hypothetical protein
MRWGGAWVAQVTHGQPVGLFNVSGCLQVPSGFCGFQYFTAGHLAIESSAHILFQRQNIVLDYDKVFIDLVTNKLEAFFLDHFFFS